VTGHIMNRCPATTEQIIPYCPDITEQNVT
jgi:hypothetical protein